MGAKVFAIRSTWLLQVLRSDWMNLLLNPPMLYQFDIFHAITISLHIVPGLLFVIVDLLLLYYYFLPKLQIFTFCSSGFFRFLNKCTVAYHWSVLHILVIFVLLCQHALLPWAQCETWYSTISITVCKNSAV